MDRKTKIFFLVVVILIIGSVALTFYRTIIKKDYIIEGQTDCDPTFDRCFIWKCDPASSAEGDGCTGDEEKDIWYYQIVQRKANQIPLCDSDSDENCQPWECDAGEEDCLTVFCDEETAAEQELECSDPVQYNSDNPPAEDMSACAEGDDQCDDQGSDTTAGSDGSGNNADTAE